MTWDYDEQVWSPVCEPHDTDNVAWSQRLDIGYHIVEHY